MTHRIDQVVDERGMRLVFQGRLDEAALVGLRAACEARRRRGERLRVVLGAGTQIEAGAVDRILEIEGIELTAESPYLSRLIDAGIWEGTQ